MKIHWLTIVFYVAAILIIYLLYKLIFQIKDKNDPRFGQSAVFIMLGLLIESIILVFSWGWVGSVVAILMGLFFSLSTKIYRRTLIIATLTAASFLLAFLSGEGTFFYLYALGVGFSITSFFFEIYKLHREAQ